jgi:hypothetical protein
LAIVRKDGKDSPKNLGLFHFPNKGLTAALRYFSVAGVDIPGVEGFRISGERDSAGRVNLSAVFWPPET